MTFKLNSLSPQFSEELKKFMQISRMPQMDITANVAQIIADIKKRGDEALLEYTAKWDHLEVNNVNQLKLSPQKLDEIASQASDEELKALKLAYERIKKFHEAQKPNDYETTDEAGVTLGWRWNAVDAVALYVPGGTAAYPSSVLMNAIPAQVAGVERIMVITPPAQLNPLVAAALKLCDITEVYTIGGAQAVAAAAYGTESIKAVDMITGPGNAFVAEAKRQVFGDVGIDMVAGPSEILIIADETANPSWLAADLLSQAEHDELAQSILISTSDDIIAQTQIEIQNHLKNLSRNAITQKSWEDFGAVIKVQNLDEACDISNKIAPEHLELMVKNPKDLLAQCKHAGSVFMGHYTPEALGDYLAGPNHVLPTSRSARFSSGLGVLNFMKRTTYIEASQQSANELNEAVGLLADGEGLPAHALSARLRLSNKGKSDE